MSFLGEIKRRKVFQVAAVYLVVAWLIMQIVDVVSEPLSLPDWFATVTILFLAIGFPIAVILAWAFDLTPEGIVRDQGSGSAPGSGRRIETVFIALLVAAVGTLLYREFTPAGANNRSDLLPNSVAILPFENLSPDPDDAYFAAGIHEQLLTELANLQDLTVIAGTTMNRYADSTLAIPDIARELRVETVMAGSVRYAGDEVRITAQLIDGASGSNLWAEEFTRRLTDIFAIQSAIATLIADELEAELTPDEQEGLEKRLTSSQEALELYLSAISVTDTNSVIPVLEEATRIDSDFAAAYGLLAYYQAAAVIGFFSTSPDDGAELTRQALSNSRQALYLDPSLGVAHAAIGAIHLANWNGEAAEESLRLASELSPSGVGVAQMYARLKRHRREYDEAIEIMERVVELDPNNPSRQQNLGVAYRYAGDYDRAVTAFLDGLELEPTSMSLNVNLAIAEARRDNFDEAIRRLQLAESLQGGAEQLPTFRIPQMARVYSIVGRPEDAMRLFRVLEEKANVQPVGEATWSAAYSSIGEHELALQHLEAALNERVPTDAGTLGQLAANVFVDPVLETDPRYREMLDQLWDDQ